MSATAELRAPARILNLEPNAPAEMPYTVHNGNAPLSALNGYYVDRAEKIRSTSQLQERITDLLSLPVEQWNRETLSSHYMRIAHSFLRGEARQSEFLAGRELRESSERLANGDDNYGRALRAFGGSLHGMEATFDTLVTFHKYEGEKLEAMMRHVYAHEILQVLGVCAAQTGDVSYLKNIFSKNSSELLYSGYLHVSQDIFRELSYYLEPDKEAKAKGELKGILTAGLKAQLINDIDILVNQHSLAAGERTRLVQLLDIEPGTLKRAINQRIEGTTGEQRTELLLNSDLRDRESPDIARVRAACFFGKFLSYVGNSKEQTTLDIFCLATGKALPQN